MPCFPLIVVRGSLSPRPAPGNLRRIRQWDAGRPLQPPSSEYKRDSVRICAETTDGHDPGQASLTDPTAPNRQLPCNKDPRLHSFKGTVKTSKATFKLDPLLSWSSLRASWELGLLTPSHKHVRPAGLLRECAVQRPLSRELRNTKQGGSSPLEG